MRRLVTCSPKYILLYALIGLLTTPSLSASSPCDLQVKKSLQKINIKGPTIFLIRTYAGFWLDKKMQAGRQLMEEGEKTKEKGKKMQEEGRKRILAYQQSAWKNQQKSPLNSPYSGGIFCADSAIKTIEGSLETTNGENIARKGIQLRFKAVHDMETLNRDHSSKQAWILIWGSFAKLARVQELRATEEKKELDKEMHTKMVEQYDKMIGQYNNTLKQGCEMLVIKYNTLMMGRRSNNQHPWECLENFVDFLLAPTTPRSKHRKVNKSTTNTKHTKKRPPIL